jgi:hypothetical protein
MHSTSLGKWEILQNLAITQYSGSNATVRAVQLDWSQKTKAGGCRYAAARGFIMCLLVNQRHLAEVLTYVWKCFTYWHQRTTEVPFYFCTKLSLTSLCSCILAQKSIVFVNTNTNNPQVKSGRQPGSIRFKNTLFPDNKLLPWVKTRPRRPWQWEV